MLYLKGLSYLDFLQDLGYSEREEAQGILKEARQECYPGCLD